MRSICVLAAAAASLTFLGAAQAQVTVDVSVNDNFFQTMTAGNAGFGTATTVINVGDTVQWTWLASRAHSVTSTDMLFDSGVLSAPSLFSFTFTAPGMYDYICIIHGFHDHDTGTSFGMTGTIMVMEVPAPAAGALLGLASLAASRRRR